MSKKIKLIIGLVVILFIITVFGLSKAEAAEVTEKQTKQLSKGKVQVVTETKKVNGEEVYINDLIVPANHGNYKICIHQNRNFPVDGHEVIVDNLSSLIERIPDAINIEIQQYPQAQFYIQDFYLNLLH